MSDTTRILLIAIGVALLVITFVPLLFMGGMMGAMMGGQCCAGGAPWVMVSLTLLILLVGGALLVAGLRH